MRDECTRRCPGQVDRDGVKIHYEFMGRAAPHAAASAGLVDRPLALVEGAGCVPCAPLPRRHLRWARQRPVGPAAGRRAYRPREFVADAIAVMDATATASRRGRRPLARRTFCRDPRGAPSRARNQRDIDCARGAFRPHIDTAERNFMDRRRDEGWAKYNRHYWQRRLSRLCRVLLRASASRAALDQADRRRVGWALETTRRTLTDTVLAPVPSSGRRRRALRTIRARFSSSMATGTNRAACKGRASHEAIGAPLVTLEGPAIFRWRAIP